MFIANLKYKKSIEEVNKVLEAHLEYLDKYFEKGKFICTGKKSFPELGGVILFNSNNLEEAKKILYEDPFYIEEISDYEIIEFQPVKFSQNLSIENLLY
ncbi:YciI family protein [Leptotrichia massiliensis]|uniref:YciI family protein n=1 Tax=Leptotrichia massiliensis TaxID=1852388 RepID=UPI0028D4AA08|nr:YciI family protein [Leptotrichia massiliensis]